MKSLSFLKLLIKTNIESSLSLKTSFFFQLVFMIFNNLIFFTIWWIFFTKFEEVNGWTLNEVEAMYGLAAGAFGISVIFGGGIFDIAKKIVSGGLDTYITQPKNPLLHVVGSKSRASGWGDIVTSFILLYMSGYLTFANFPKIVVLLFSAAAVLSSAGILAQCLAFWLGPIDQLARQFFEFVLTFSVYPQTIFPLGFKIVLFTILPAGFISYLPVEAIRGNSWAYFFAVLAAGVFFLILSWLVFLRGLKKYESGNLISY